MMMIMMIHFSYGRSGLVCSVFFLNLPSFCYFFSQNNKTKKPTEFVQLFFFSSFLLLLLLFHYILLCIFPIPSSSFLLDSFVKLIDVCSQGSLLLRSGFRLKEREWNIACVCGVDLTTI